MVREQNTADSRYLAVTEKHLGKDYIGVYDILDGYNLLRVSRGDRA